MLRDRLSDMPQVRRRALRAAQSLLPAVALALAGCSTFSPTTTSAPRAYGEGVNTTIGPVSAQALVLVGEVGKPGLLSGALVNSGQSAEVLEFRFSADEAPIKLTIPAGQLVTLNGTGKNSAEVLVPAMDKPAGAEQAILISSKRYGNIQVSVPVVSATGDYATLTPKPSPTTSRPSPSGTATSSPSAS